ncbi:MAG: SusC/RagA family TonB-linked outer membrane protein [Tannerellaceae bacterium]|nr:SusC/RagA family TonB-linked outer membrane protein [Tannerellaceae bacterium]
MDAQNQIELPANNLSLGELIAEIENQTDYLFLFRNNDVDINRMIRLSSKREELPALLEAAFRHTDIHYRFQHKYIVLAMSREKILPDNNQEGRTQQTGRRITGTITDTQGEPVIGANVVQKGTSHGNITDVDGKFTIEVPAEAILQISYVGFISQEIVVGNRSSFAIILEEDDRNLEEVVVVGYGVQRKSDITGAISQVRTEDMENRVAENLGQVLQGKSAGVQILFGSGAPGSGSQIRIRGFSSNTASEPLFIVDGLVVTQIDYLDPENIESIEILKDAASAAIYGAEAGNGVVLITTKTGGKDKSGKGKVFFNMQYTNEQASHLPKVLGAKDYIDFMIEAGQTSRQAIDAFYNGTTDTNWGKEVFERGIAHRYTVGFQNGNDLGNFFVSLASQKRNGIFAGDKDVYNRFSGQINADVKINKQLKIGTTNNISQSLVKAVSQRSETNSVMGAVILHDPLTPVTLDMNHLPSDVQEQISLGKKYLTNEKGEIWGMSNLNQSQMFNPFFGRDKTDNNINSLEVNGTAFAEVTPLENLVFTSKLGYRIFNRYSSEYNYPFYYNSLQFADKESLAESATQGLYYQWENYANYLFRLGKSNITLMGGMSFKKNTYRDIEGETDELANSALNYRYLDFSTDGAIDDIGGILYESAGISYFGRLSWGFDNRYNLQANFRADSYDASKLDKGLRWGYFPSFSAGWTLSNEAWMERINAAFRLSNLRLRASWGINGNVNVLHDYQYTNTLASDYFYMDGTGKTVYGTFPQTRLPNPGLTWEESRQIDLGIDARFFNGAFSLGVDFYSKTTEGLLIEITPALSTGASTKFVNAGSVYNRGFEFEAGWKNRIGYFSYSLNGNLSTLYNVVKSAPSIIAGTSTHAGTTISYFEEGYPVWYLKTYKVKQIGDEGYAVYKDIDGVEGITDADREFAGSAIPNFTYGLTFSASYKEVDMTVFASGLQGNELYYALNAGVHPTFNRLQYTTHNRWTANNTNTRIPSAAGQFDERYYASDGFVYDGSYFKIKQIQLGYTTPQKILRKLFVASLRAYLSLDDFFTLTSYPGLDPETMVNVNAGMAVDKGTYPVSRKVTLGLNVSF